MQEGPGPITQGSPARRLAAPLPSKLCQLDDSSGKDAGGAVRREAVRMEDGQLARPAAAAQPVAQRLSEAQRLIVRTPTAPSIPQALLPHPQRMAECLGLATVPAHPNLLMRSAVAAHAAVQARGVGAVLQVFPAGCRQYSLQLLGPLLINPGEPEHPIRGQSEVSEHGPERLAFIDRVQELLPYFDG